MKTDRPLISFLVATNEGPEDILRCLDSVLAQSYGNIEIVVLDDNSGQGICEEIAEKCNDPRIRCITSGKPLGVAGGRNRLINEAKGDILITLDDDAVLRYRDSGERVVSVFKAHPDAGLLALKIVAFKGSQQQRHQVPFAKKIVKRSPEIVNMTRFASYYIGAGHAVRREVYEKCGLYQDDLYFGLEELDLAYRIIERGYGILYCPEVFVEHYPHANSLKRVRSGYMFYLTRNRIWVNYKYLPFFPFVTSTLFWCVVLLSSSVRKGEFLDALRGLVEGFRGLVGLERKVLNKKTVEYLKRNHGRLYK
jgi:GT2 family glycosyltransferase